MLQVQMMKQMLLENNIECWADRGLDTGVIPTGEFGEIGLWVSKKDEERARELLEALEEEMSVRLDRELPEDNQEGQG